jgi:methylamine dehydrogenase heavy chain
MMRISGSSLWRRAALVAAMMLALPVAQAELPADIGVKPENVALPPMTKHWVWVNDMVFPHMSDAQIHLIDGDSGRFLGMVSTGYSGHGVLSPDGKTLWSAETYFSRHTRGTRTDVVTVYDTSTLKATAEIAMPPKRASAIPVVGMSGVTDDGRFLLTYNFNPAQSVSVVDTRANVFVGEVETPGCALVHPSGPRSFFGVCADGGVMTVVLDDTGHVASQSHSDPIFDMSKDPVTEKPIRIGDVWYFVTFDGDIRPLKANAKGVTALPSWSLFSAEEKKAGWRPGGVLQMAGHAGQKRLYAIVHQGPRESHKDGGRTIHVYDLESHARVQTIHTKHPVGVIAVSSDDHPLLFGASPEETSLYIYDARSGKLRHTVTEAGTSIMYLNTL